MNRFLCTLIVLALATGISAVEVGGHISRSTTWSPENNPYNVTSFLYIDSQVTLTILPGTEIRILGTDKNIIWDFMWSGNTEPLGKMIIINGKIEAIGTPDQPITFDRMQEDSEIRWGSIYISPNAPASTFEYCEFRHAYFCDYVPGSWSRGAIEFHNGIINVRSCVFENNLCALQCSYLKSDILIYDCKFIAMENSYPPPIAYSSFIMISAAPEPAPERNYKVTIAKCYFTGSAALGPVGYYMDVLKLNNVMHNFISRDEQSSELRAEYGSISSYGNISYNGTKGWGCYSATVTDTVFARRNRMIKYVIDNDPLRIGGSGFGTNYVSDNYMYGNVQVGAMSSNATTNYIYNNIIENKQGNAVLNFENINPANQGGQMRFYNNLVRYVGDSYALICRSEHTSPFVYNNTFVNYITLHSSFGDCDEVFANNIIDFSHWSSGGIHDDHHPMLYSNCLSLPLIPPWDFLDGGGNIVTDPMFADSLNADYSLQAESPCIDAGMNRPDLPAFDLRYHRRIAPGSDNGPRRVDIGAYEYNSVYIGGINGSVHDAVTGEVVDCVKIEIISKLPEFSDTLGCFQYPTGAGVYELRASRWDYHDRAIRNVTVIEGEDTILNIPLMPLTVSNEDELLPSENLLADLKNYPNPFNPKTTISFILPEAGTVVLSIYNLKGQKVCELYNGILNAGNHNLVWNGIDANGRAVSSGIYFVRIESGKRKQSHKMILMK